jgi:hypothetical protein
MFLSIALVLTMLLTGNPWQDSNSHLPPPKVIVKGGF